VWLMGQGLFVTLTWGGIKPGIETVDGGMPYQLHQVEH
jgi:hypothetical protein